PSRTRCNERGTGRGGRAAIAPDRPAPIPGPLALAILLAAVEVPASLLVEQGPAALGEHCRATGNGRALLVGREPARDVRKLRKVDALALVRAAPRKAGDVGNGVLGAREPFTGGEPAIHDTVEAARL